MKKKFLLIILCILCFIQVLYLGFHLFIKNKANSNEIIGGADGPTSIFVSNHSGSNLALYAVVILIVILMILLLYVFKHKKSK